MVNAELEDFVKFCQEHPELRFWQAVRAWSGFNKILAVRVEYVPVPDPNPLMESGYVEHHFDTFYWEGKNGN